MINPQSAIRNPQCSGQAMVEVAVFGTFLLFVLTLIVRFGMSTYHQQQVSQEAFRHALRAAFETRAYDDTIKKRPSTTRCDPESDPDCRFSPTNQGQVVVVRDRYIPDPGNPFSTGFHTPLASNGSVVWGTDSAEYVLADVENSTDVPEVIYRINGQEFVMLLGRFRVDEHPFGPGIAKLLCDYDDIFSTVFADFLDAGGEHLDDVTLDFSSCATTGLAKIDTDGATPSTVRMEIVDTCLADFIDVDFCEKQCQEIQDAGLPVPAYCASLPDEGVVQGLDFGNFTRRHEVENSLRQQEDRAAIRSNTSINETSTVARIIGTNPNVTPDLPVQVDEDGSFVDATTSVQRRRSHNWATNW